jgi:hypothetical protein
MADTESGDHRGCEIPAGMVLGGGIADHFMEELAGREKTIYCSSVACGEEMFLEDFEG